MGMTPSLQQGPPKDVLGMKGQPGSLLGRAALVIQVHAAVEEIDPSSTTPGNAFQAPGTSPHPRGWGRVIIPIDKGRNWAQGRHPKK